MRKLLILSGLALCACSIVEDDVTPASVTNLSLATYNLYLGADLIGVFAEDSSTLDSAALGDRVRDTFANVEASDPPARMDSIAAQLAARPVDVLALQEVSLWQTQTPADGTATAATEVRFDFLDLLLSGLARRGLTYEVAVENRLSDVELTAAVAPATDVRFVDRDVILVRADSGVAWSDAQAHTFAVQLPVPTPLGTVTVLRGWASIEAVTAGRRVRIVDTHLEAAADPIRDAQAAELLPAASDASPLVMAGDFNFAPGSLPYELFRSSGLVDEWPVVNPSDPGNTCCQDATLLNPNSFLGVRIDLAFTRGPIHASDAQLLGATPNSRTPSGLWPSDHAGVRFSLGFE